MANNNNIYNAVIAGAGGGNQQRWITDVNSAEYTAFLGAVQAVAETVDSEIAPIDGDANIAQTALMQEIVAAVFATRFIQSTTEADYVDISQAIVALYERLDLGLLAPTNPGEIIPLTLDYWTDPFTDVPADEQNGAIDRPYSTLQAAYDGAYAASLVIGDMPAILLQPGEYTGDVTDANGVAVAFQGVGQRGASIGGSIIGDLISALGTTWLLNQVDMQGDIDTTGTVRMSHSTQSGGTVTCGTLNANLQSTVDTVNAANVALADNTVCQIANVTASLTLQNGASVGLCDGADSASMTAYWASIGGATSFGVIGCNYCQVGNLTALAIDLQDCRIVDGSTITCSFLTIDSLTYQRALKGGVTFTVATTLTISDQQLKATVSINVPTIATATDVTYVNTTLTGVLAGLFAVGDSVIVNPQADIPGAGACIASARISATNTLRVGFRGVTTGGAMNFTVARPS